MAIKTVLTDKGMELLANSSNVMGGEYWLGYCAFAYVPQEWKASIDPVEAGMTKLTKYGDVIYNIYQGDLLNTGYSGSAHGYNTNVKAHYNYAIGDDGSGNTINKLVLWERNPDYNDAIPPSTNNREYFGYHVYDGTSGGVDPVSTASERSALPIPAPLFYMGDVYGTSGTINTLIDFLVDDEVFLPSIARRSTTYTETDFNVPKISVDTRPYEKSSISLTDPVTPDPDALSTGQAYIYNSVNLLPQVSGEYNHWYGAPSTRLVNTGDPLYADELYEFVTISNYNRYHTPEVEYGENPDWRSVVKANNMSKMTKYFPIESFDVLSSNTGINSNGERRTLATGIKAIISVNLAPTARDVGYDENGDYVSYDVVSENAKYGQPSEGTSGIDDDDMYNIRTSSFQFNRIGLYAVKTRKEIAQNDPNAIGDATRVDDQVFFEIDPDVEPVLFAVVDWDNTQTISETGDPSAQFDSEISLNLSTFDDGIGESSLIRDTAVFHNLYETDAIKYYKNQLISNAQVSHSVIQQGFQLGNLQSIVRVLQSKVNAMGNYGSGDGTSIGNVGVGTVAVYKGVSSAGVHEFKTIRSIDGKITVTQTDDCTINIGAGTVVTSAATTASTDVNKVPLAVFSPSSTTQINSTINQATLSGGILNLESTSSDLEQFTEAGITVNDRLITSNGLIETVISKIEVVDILNSGYYAAGDITIPFADLVDALNEASEDNILQYDLLRSLHWEFADAPGSAYYDVEITDSGGTYIATLGGNAHGGATGARIVEPSQLMDSIADYDVVISNLTSVSASAFTMYIVTERATICP